ncbi:MAG: metallophosphoesterase [Bacteroidota bacterium]
MKQLPDRRSFLKNIGLLGAGSLLAPLSFKADAATPELLITPGQRKRLLRVAHLTDIHVKPDKIAEAGFAAALSQVNELKDKPDFIMNGGDAIMNAVSFSKEQVRDQWNCFHRIMASHNSLPIHHCIGNHDLYGWALPGTNHTDGKQWALDEYKLLQPYYSFAKNGWKFIVLDSIHPRKSVPGYFGKLDDVQLNWLEAELVSTPPDIHVCIISHIPILAVCTLFDNSYVNHNHWFVPDNTLHADAHQLRDLFYRYKNVKTCLSGHIHLIDHVNYLGTDYYCNGAVSGGWWKGDHQQFSPSFIIMNFFSDGTTEREVYYYDWKQHS